MTDTLSERLSRLTPEQRARLARTMREKKAGAAAAGPSGGGRPIPVIDRSSGRLPMSFAQRRLFFLQRLHPDSPAYNTVEAVRVRGRLDTGALQAALATVVARHEVLRTTCAAGDGDGDGDGEPVLVVAEAAAGGAAPAIDVVDLAGPCGGNGVGPAALGDALDLFAGLAERPFDLEAERPLRVTLARIADDDHALLFVVHHIASDAWSCRLLLRELFQAYTATVTGAAPDLAPLAVQYADVAAWQQAEMAGDGARRHLEYWRERLAGLPPVLELPLDGPRPAVRSDHGAEHHLELDAAARTRLHAAARSASVTPFALLLTAFGYVLHRHCATEDVAVGTPVSGRDRVEVEPLLGCFVNTVVLRLDLGDAPTRRALVRRVWERTLEDFEHQSLPFEHLVAELNPERDLSVGQLVQVMCNYYPATGLAEDVPGLDVALVDVARARAKFDLTCTAVDSPDALRVTFTYATQLLDADQVARIAEHFGAVLDALVDDLDAPMATLPPVPPSDAAPLAPPPAPAAARPGRPVLERFEAHAAAHPDRTAVQCPGGAVTYRDLDAAAERLAAHLAGRAPADGPVALLFERSVDYVVAMLAALKAGRPYVPLDPAMPADHVAGVLAACGAPLVLTHAAVDWADVAAAAPAAAEFVAVDDVAAPPAGARSAHRRAGADEAMYVLFTSGSTGRPKGVVVEHRHFTSYLTSLVDRLALPDGLHFAIVSTFAADLGLTNLYGALATGGTLHVLPYEWATDPDRFADHFRRHPIDVMKLVPSHLQAVAEAGLLADVVPARHLVLAGEACPWDLVDAVRAARPGCAVWNHYGPTETTVSVLAYPVPAEPPPGRGATVPLGFPFDHVRACVVDRHLRPVPIGAAGELLITGTSVARGYLTPDDGGGDRFVPDPFSDEPGARAYRSGDRARVRADGTIEFLGRLDRQTKIRGYRVEPSHVEAVLRRHPGVADVAVAVRDDRNGRAALVAYYVPDAGAAAGGDAVGQAVLAEHARGAMPPYMVPSAYVAVDRLPLTPNGKLDWRALPDPDPNAARERPAAPPRDARDAAMVERWRDVLGLDEIGIDDDFFESGGDSFAAMKLARRIGDGVRVVSIFQHPTVRRLVDVLGGEEAGGLLCRLPGRTAGAGTTTTTTTATVVAVPFGGATAASYGELARALPPELPLYAVELPGHDFGRADQALVPFEDIADRCVDEIRRTITGPVVVYGHCVGAALAFEVAQRLEAGGGDLVGVVVGGAFPAPRLPGRLFDLWARLVPADRWRSDRLYRDQLRAMGGLTQELDPAEQAFSLRALRHDARESEDLYSRRCHDPAHRRTVAALSVVGERDRVTEFHHERHREWNLLCADTELAVIPGAGHYFLKHQADELADVVVAWTRRRLAEGEAEEQQLPEHEPAAHEAAGAEPVAAGHGAPAGPRRRVVRATPAPAPARDLRGFALVTLGQLVSQIGSRAFAFALGIWVYLATGSVTQFSVILVTALLPGLLALPFAGAAADRWDRRLLMLAGEVVNAAGTGLCLVAFATGTLEVWHIYVAASLGSIATSFQQPAYLAAVAQLVPKQYLSRANGVVQALVALTQALGPLLGGALIVLVGLGGVMLVDLATVVVAVATLLAVRLPDLSFRRREETIWKEIDGGVRYIARRPPMVAMVVFFLGYNLVLGFALALVPPMVLSFASAGTLSVATMIGALGGITGGVVMAVWGGFERRATGMVGFAALTGLGMILAGSRPSPVFALAGLAAVMGSIALINGHWQTMIQVKVGMELQGRVLATNRMIANLTEPVGYVGAGWLADAFAEPAMAHGGWLSDSVGSVLGAGPGRGMALVVVVLGGLQVALAVVGLRWRTLHHMEDVLPDAVPGAVVTWDRDALQREADRRLLAGAPAGPA